MRTYKKRRGHLVCWWVGGCPKHPSHVLFSCISTTHVTKPSKLRRFFFTPVMKLFMLRRQEKCFPATKLTKITKINQNLACGQTKKIEIPIKRFSHVTHPHTKKTLEELNISTCHITGQIKFKIN